jgi:sucrose-6-phosphate hydrolase SacC (GH32 family)
MSDNRFSRTRRQFIRKVAGTSILLASQPVFGTPLGRDYRGSGKADPTQCAYAPPGEYIKDHTIITKDGWWHLFSISGTRGYYHGYNGNEETFSWSVSKDLVHWEFRGHVMHPSQRPGTYDQHEVWAPFCMEANDKFYMFYTGIIHPHRPLEYRKLGHGHPWVVEGHRENQGLAVSEDLTDWVKVDDPVKGLNIPGRDSNVIRDEANQRWLLYSTGQGEEVNGKRMNNVLVSESVDLLKWKHIGSCALFTPLDVNRDYGSTVESHGSFKAWAGTTESMFVMRHPLTGQWIMMGNWQYVVSDDPADFKSGEVRYYDTELNGNIMDMGFACEMVFHEGMWYRSGVFGEFDHWKLGFTEVAWDKSGAFHIVKPSIVTNKV